MDTGKINLLTAVLKKTLRSLTILNSEKEIVSWTPRLETFALASSGEHTKGIIVMGIDPEKENAESKLSQKLIGGKYLEDSDKSVLLAEGLAEYLKLKVNDTVILLGQGYHGNMAAAKYPIKGIVKLGIPEMNKGMVWLPMAGMQRFFEHRRQIYFHFSYGEQQK